MGMRGMILCVWTAFVTLFVFQVHDGRALEIGVRANIWINDISGTVQGNNGNTGSELRLSGDLDLGIHGDPFGEAFVGIGRHHVTFGLTYYDQEGTRNAKEDILFGGTTIPAGTQVKSNLQWIMLELEYAYTLLDLTNILAGFSLDGFVAGRYQNGEMSLDGGNQYVKRSISWVRPLAGVRLNLGFLADILEVRLKGGGIKFSNEHLLDLLGEVSFTPLPFVGVGVGYRHLSINVDANGLEQDYNLSGPFAGLTVSF